MEDYISNDVLQCILSSQLTPNDVIKMACHETNPILFHNCILSFLKKWIQAVSFWEYGKQFHSSLQKKTHSFLAYQVYNGKKNQFTELTNNPLPTFTDIRKEWSGIYSMGIGTWSTQDNFIWKDWLQTCANQYPTEKRITCSGCQITIPQEEMWNDIHCISCHNNDSSI